MATALLDTNIVSYAFKQDSRIQDYSDVLAGCHMAISFMTVAELFQWAAVRNWGPRRIEHLERALNGYLILPVDYELCRVWGQIRAARRTLGP